VKLLTLRTRKRTTNVERLSLYDLARESAEHPYPTDVKRPERRSDCLSDGVNAERPCPFVSCKYHLALDVNAHGSVIENFPGLELEELPDTCALDAADREEGMVLEDVGKRLNVTRERVRQIADVAGAKYRNALVAMENPATKPDTATTTVKPVPAPPPDPPMPPEPVVETSITATPPGRQAVCGECGEKFAVLTGVGPKPRRCKPCSRPRCHVCGNHFVRSVTFQRVCGAPACDVAARKRRREQGKRLTPLEQLDEVVRKYVGQ
jgi:hypothetical protein